MAQTNTKKRIKKWLTIIAAIYVAGALVFYFFHERFIFQAQTLPADHEFKFSHSFREINLTVNDNKNLSIVRFTVPDSLCRGVVLYFHGNKKNVERYADFAKHFTQHRYEVWMMDYPGFGKSTGARSEDILYNDALELYKMASARFSKDSIILYGKSIGTGIAAHLAAVRDCKRVLLETPYYSLDDVLRRYAFIYPVGLLSKYHFPLYRDFPLIRVPVTLFHGTADGTIPYKHSTRLMKLAKPGDELVSFENGEHNNLTDFPLYHQKLDSLLK